MSIVVEMRECRIWPWTDLGSAPACTSQVACEVRSHCQLTNESPTLLLAGGLDEPLQDVVIPHRLPFFHRLKHQVIRVGGFDQFVIPYRVTSFDIDRQRFQLVNASNHFWETPIVAALAADFGADQSAEIPLVDRDGIEVNASLLQTDEFTDSKPRPHSRVSGSVFSSELILTAKSSRTEYQGGRHGRVT
jgi:hypothetical protein